jgi:lipopolysaccharide/colanic/teichoic acid biosynthesis glycosyltransferase
MIRTLDIVLSLIAFLVFLPVGLIIVLILRFTGEGEVFFFQERMGKGGKIFKLIKFATMLKNSPLIGSMDITVKNDTRILPFGHFLRRTKLNELPQIINILLGDMSIVGPRPQTPKNFEFFPSEGRNVILSMRPGLTGIGSIVFRDEENMVANSGKDVNDCYRSIIGPHKIELEAWYYERRNLITNILIVVITIWVIIRPKSEIYRKVWPSLPPLPEALRESTSSPLKGVLNPFGANK